MSAAVIFNIAATLAGFLIPIVVMAAVALLVRLLFRHSAAAPMPTQPRRQRWLWLGLIPLAGVALFIGLMVASIGGALYPPLTRVAAPLACDGEFSIETYQYSYKPGQHGSGYRTFCTDRASGERKDVSLPTFLWNSLVFAGMAFVPLLLLALLLVRRLRRAFASFRSSVTTGTPPDFLRQFVESTTLKSQAAPDGRSVEDRLRELLRLRDKGLIDDDDYEARKAGVLSQL